MRISRSLATVVSENHGRAHSSRDRYPLRKRCASTRPSEQSIRITSDSFDISSEKTPTTAPD